MNSLFKVLILSALVALIQGCKSPQVEATYYTTKEDASSSRTVFISTFSVTCKEGHPGSLFAEVGDKPLAVGKSTDGLVYQVSWVEEHKLASAGTYNIKLYDESGYSNLRKAQRAGENTDAITPFATVVVNHSGVWKGSYFSSDAVACVVALALFWFAYSKKSEILA